MEPMRADLIGLFELDELKKYLTEDELPAEEK
jgi:succinate dehydrogenase / fumarate reductase flavoprotein subunit